MHPMRCLRLAALTSVIALRLDAQAPSGLAADVETVTSGGSWEQGSSEGRYRAVIRSGGFEHVISTLTIDWITSPTETDSARVVASVTIPTAGVSLHDPEFSYTDSGWTLSVCANDSHFDPPRLSTLHIALGAPGSAKVELPGGRTVSKSCS